jgi:two-component system CheB/CheR fusion protein
MPALGAAAGVEREHPRARGEVDDAVRDDRPGRYGARHAGLAYQAHTHVVEGALVTFVDVTRLVEAEARQRALLEELNQSVRSVLGVIAAITDPALDASGSPERIAEAFRRRVQAVALGYDLLARTKWAGVSLHDIIVGHWTGFRCRRLIAIQGPQPDSAGRHAALGVIFHELAATPPRTARRLAGGRVAAF